jgi:hypothetical protein
MCTWGWCVIAEPQGIQHGSDADPGAEMLGIAGNRDRGLGRRLEQEIVEHGLVLVCDAGDG